MASFEMCEACREEYEDPANRRFHAQPTCCPDCGPQTGAHDKSRCAPLDGRSGRFFVDSLLSRQGCAMKGLGRFHLVCDATNQDAVAELRRRKKRDAKPFAVMVADLAAAGRIREINARRKALLASPRRPIVLLRKRREPAEAEGFCVAADKNCRRGRPRQSVPGTDAPLHAFASSATRAAGRPLVMTSGNRSDEPIAYQNEEAISRLGAIADASLRTTGRFTCAATTP